LKKIEIDEEETMWRNRRLTVEAEEHKLIEEIYELNVEADRIR
jgi:hypothetical protein